MTFHTNVISFCRDAHPRDHVVKNPPTTNSLFSASSDLFLFFNWFNPFLKILLLQDHRCYIPLHVTIVSSAHSWQEHRESKPASMTTERQWSLTKYKKVDCGTLLDSPKAESKLWNTGSCLLDCSVVPLPVVGSALAMWARWFTEEVKLSSFFSISNPSTIFNLKDSDST